MTEMTRDATADSGYHLVFDTGADYARRYLQTAAGASGHTLYAWPSDRDLDEAVAGRLDATVPELDRETVLAALPEQARAHLLEKEAEFLEAMRWVYPPLGGERIDRESVSILGETFATAPPGSLVYRRSTDQGALTVVDSTKRVDAATGSLRHVAGGSPAPSHERNPEPAIADASAAAAADGGSMSTVEAGLSLVQGLLSAFGKGGAVVSTGISLLELLFGSDDSDSLPQDINQLVVQDFANDHVKTDLATIVGYSQWLSEAMKKAPPTGDGGDSTSGFASAKEAWNGYIVDACDPGSELMTAISNLQNGTYTSDPPYSVVGLPAYLLGASLHLTFERTKLLFSTDGKSFKSEQMNYIVNVATDYMTYINAALALINQAIDDRLSSIGQPIYANYQYGTATRAGMIYQDYGYVYVQDANYASFPTQTVWDPVSYAGHTYAVAPNIVQELDMPTGCGASTDPTPLITYLTTWRTTYIQSLNDQLAAKYNADATRRANIATTTADLKKTVEQFSTALV